MGPSSGSKNTIRSLPVTVCPARSESRGIRLFRKPSGPISHDSGDRMSLILSKIGFANCDMKEPRSRVMSPNTTCGAAMLRALPGVQLRAKSTSSLAEIEGRILAKSAPKR